MIERVAQLEQEVAYLRGIIDDMMFSDRMLMRRDLEFVNGRNVILSTSVGSKFGTSALQKLGFYGATPVVQAGSISAPSAPGAVYAQGDAQSAVAAINSIRTALTNCGITA